MQSSPHHRGLFFFFHHHSFHSFVPGLQGDQQAWSSLPDPPARDLFPSPGRCPMPRGWGCPAAPGCPAPSWGSGTGQAASPCPAGPSRSHDTRNENSKTVHTHAFNAVLSPRLKNWQCDSVGVSKVSPSNICLKGKLCFLTWVCSRPWCFSRRTSQTGLKGSSFP